MKRHVILKPVLCALSARMRRALDQVPVGLPQPGAALLMLLCLSLVVMNVNAQGNEPVGALRVGMQSPTAASLGKFGDVPVSLYTGTPNISVPLYEVKGRSLSVPISLAYHASGIRVEEIPGWVGMGWALNAGGVITRTMRGLPDDSDEGYPITHGAVEAADTDPPNPTVINQLIFDVADQHTVDPEPDQFFFNMAGRSGQFVFGDANNVTLIRSAPYQKLKFEFRDSTLTPPLNDIGAPSMTVITRWTITAEDGTKYIFGDLPETPSEVEGLEWTWNETEGVSCGTNPEDRCVFVSSWYLTRIESAQGNDQITFFYLDNGTGDDVVHKHLTYTEERHSLTSACLSPSSEEVTNYTHTRSLWLNKIEAATEHVWFDLELRQDALNAWEGRPEEGNQQEMLLDGMRIFDSSGMHHLKTFDFAYSYMGDPGPEEQWRLQLDKVVEQDSIGTSMNPGYQFSYVPGVLPAFTSNAIDHWGYYNGALNNDDKTRLPALEVDLTGRSQGYGVINLPGSDREPSPDDMKIGMLQTITYPTGGTTTFTFEPHDYGYVRGQHVPPFTYGSWEEEKIELPDIQGGTYVEDTLVVEAYDGQTRPVEIFTHLVITDRNSGSTIQCGSDPFDLCVRIENMNGDLIYRQTESPHDSQGGATCNEPSGLSDPVTGDRNEEFTVTCDLPQGSYKLIGEVSSACFNATACSLKAKVTWRNSYPSTGRVAGGLRIQQVAHADSLSGTLPGTPDVVLNYEYDDITLGRSSGVAVTEPRYHYLPAVEQVPAPPQNCDYLARSAISFAGLGLTQGAPVGYRRVLVRPGAGDQGYTEHRFTTAFDSQYQDSSVDDEEQWPFAARTSFDYGRGFEMQSRVYNQSGQKQRKTLNDRFDSYWDDITQSQATTKLYTSFSLRRVRMQVPGPEILEYTFWRFYDVISSWLHPESETVTVYDEAGNNGVTTTRTFTYDADDLQLDKLDELNTDGRTRTTEYEYAHERHKPSMANENMLAQVYSQTVSDDNGDVAKQWTTWKHLGNGKWRPDKEHVWVVDDGSAPSDPDSETLRQITYDTYDAYGRVKAQTDALGRQVTFEYNWPGTAPNDLLLSKVEQDNLSVEYDYHSAGHKWGLISELTDENGDATTFNYDGFRRLVSMSLPEGGSTTYAYNQLAIPNYITTTTARNPGENVVSKAFFDGLGRPIQTQLKEGGSTHIVTATEFDNMGRPSKTWKPYRSATNGAYQDLTAVQTGAENEYDTLDCNSVPYAETSYLADPLARVDETIPPHCSGSSPSMTIDYGTEGGNTFVLTTDEEGNQVKGFTDGFGNQVRTVAGVSAPEEAETIIDYDILGNIVAVKPPNYNCPSDPQTCPSPGNANWVTSYTYDPRSLLIEKNTPDTDGGSNGDFRYTYDDAGNLRFVIDPVRGVNVNGGYLFTDYDAFNRVVKTGLCPSSSPPGDPNATTACPNEQDVVIYTYDTYALSQPKPPPALINEGNPLGNVTQVEFNAQDYYQYFYDNEGRVVDFFVHLEGQGSTLIEYDYDFLGNVTEIIYQRNDQNDELTLSYAYDGAGRLKTVTSQTRHDTGEVEEASYEDYRATGQVEALQLGPSVIPEINYTYHIRDWLTTINDPTSATLEPFALGLSYEDNGNVASAEWATKENPFEYGDPGQQTFRIGYDFSYDALNRLTEGNFKYYDNGWQLPHTAFDVGVTTPIEYDHNGNIKKLERLNDQGSGIPIDYQYGTPGSNRLTSVSGGLQAGPFAYDANGNMTRTRTSHPTDDIIYERRNLPVTFPLPNDTELRFRYDANGQRIYKGLFDSNDNLIHQTFYIRGVDGAVIAVHIQDDEPLRLEYWNILSGGTVLGRIVPPSN